MSTTRRSIGKPRAGEFATEARPRRGLAALREPEAGSRVHQFQSARLATAPWGKPQRRSKRQRRADEALAVGVLVTFMGLYGSLAAEADLLGFVLAFGIAQVGVLTLCLVALGVRHR